MAHYHMKCCLDRLFAVRNINHGTISWWPTQCPSYTTWYKELYAASKDFDEDDHTASTTRPKANEAADLVLWRRLDCSMVAA